VTFAPGSHRHLVRFVAVPAVVVVLLAGLSSAGAATLDDGDGRRSDGRVLVISIPDLTWADLDPGRTPRLWSVVTSASVALLSTRTADDVDGPASAYLTLGAGRRAGAAPGLPTGRADQRGESVVVPAFGRQVERNEELRYGAVPGSLGGALSDGGLGVAVIGDASATADGLDGRAVALATADPTGRTAGGRVDGLLVADPMASGGVRLDRSAVVEATETALVSSSVVVVEASDLERSVRAAPDRVGADEGDRVGLRRTDELVGALVELIDPAMDTVLVISPTSAGGDRRPGVFAWTGPGVGSGPVRSASTRRDGYVSLTDVASTILGIVGLPVPADLADTPIEPRIVEDGTTPADRIEALAGAAVRATERDRTVGPVGVLVVLLSVLSGLIGLVSARSGATAPHWARWICASTMSLPVAAFLVGWWPGVTAGVPLVLIGAALVAGVIGLAALGSARHLGPDVTPIVPAAATVAVLLVDVVAGARLQIDTPLGYSATVAGRFAGLGNQAAAYLLAATLALIASGWVVLERRGRPGRVLLSWSVVVATMVAVVTGAPWWGSDVGGLLAALPALVVVVVVSRERDRVGRRVVFGAAAALLGAGGLLLAAGLWDRSRPASTRTHLGRFVDDLLAGDAVPVLERKLSASWDVLTSTPWTVAVPLLLAGLASLAWMPRGRRWSVVDRHPELRAFGASITVAGVLGWGLNDSGVAVAAAMLAIAVPYVACVATVPAADLPREADASPSTGDPMASEAAA
jgi:hypothetical protein